MPTKAPTLKPCGHITTDDRCQRCRPSSSVRGRVYPGCEYNSTEWRTLRAEILNEQPLCRCPEHASTEPDAVFGSKPDAPKSTMVEHTIPHRGNRALFLDKANLRAMAKSCADRKTASHDGGFGNPQRPAHG